MTVIKSFVLIGSIIKVGVRDRAYKKISKK
jgi:hypothetical protein